MRRLNVTAVVKRGIIVALAVAAASLAAKGHPVHSHRVYGFFDGPH